MQQVKTTIKQDWGHDIYPSLSWFRQERVSTAHVMVVGCGALGNEVLKNLVLFGIQHLVVVDFDYVEASNLSRSVLFSSADAARHRRKVEVVKERLQQLNPAVDVTTIDGDICYDVGLGLLRRMDVVIGCVDNRWARYCINRLCMRAGRPWVDGGIEGLEGTVRVFMPGKNCYACNLGTEGLKELARRQPCSGIIRRNEAAGRAPTTPVIASIIGAVEVQEAMKLIHPEELERGTLTSLCGKMFCYEGQHLTTKTVAFQAYDDDCPVHEQWTDIRPTSVSATHTVTEAFDKLQRELPAHDVTILLTGDCFVDEVEDRRSGKHIEVMCAGHLVADKIGAGVPGDYYQHEFRSIDGSFPYPQLTLWQLGIPANDVLHVRTEQGDRYVEMEN